MVTPRKQVVSDPLARSEFWRRVAGASFGLWALMFPILVATMRSAINDASASSAAVAAALVDYKLATERRITLLEERQQFETQLNLDQNRRLDGLEHQQYQLQPHR